MTIFYTDREIKQIRDALDDLRSDSLARSLVECRYQTEDSIRQFFKALGFQCSKSVKHEKTVSFIVSNVDMPDWHIFHGRN